MYNNNTNNQRNLVSNSLFAVFNHPQYQGIMEYINQNGGNAKSAFYNMAAQRGVDPNSILSQLR